MGRHDRIGGMLKIRRFLLRMGRKRLREWGLVARPRKRNRSERALRLRWRELAGTGSRTPSRQKTEAAATRGGFPGGVFSGTGRHCDVPLGGMTKFWRWSSDFRCRFDRRWRSGTVVGEPEVGAFGARLENRRSADAFRAGWRYAPQLPSPSASRARRAACCSAFLTLFSVAVISCPVGKVSRTSKRLSCSGPALPSSV